MLALLAVVVFAQSQVSVQIGKERQDSIEKAKRDSIAIRREQRIDSMRVRALECLDRHPALARGQTGDGLHGLLAARQAAIAEHG